MSTPVTDSETVISTVAALETFLSTITLTSTVFLDLEGNNLSRHGTLSLLTILIHPENTTHLIDVQTLRHLAFTTPASNNPHKTLKAILESPSIPKYLWDTRNDADALWSHYEVALDGVTDVQLMENASRKGSIEFLRGLDTCVRYDLELGPQDLEQWLWTKKEVRRMMDNDVFSERPMEEETVRYCVGDVQHLPRLYKVYREKLNGEWMEKVMVESKKRVEEALAVDYEPMGPSKKFGPWNISTSGVLEDEGWT